MVADEIRNARMAGAKPRKPKGGQRGLARAGLPMQAKVARPRGGVNDFVAVGIKAESEGGGDSGVRALRNLSLPRAAGGGLDRDDKRLRACVDGGACRPENVGHRAHHFGLTLMGAGAGTRAIVVRESGRINREGEGPIPTERDGGAVHAGVNADG